MGEWKLLEGREGGKEDWREEGGSCILGGYGSCWQFAEPSGSVWLELAVDQVGGQKGARYGGVF